MVLIGGDVALKDILNRPAPPPDEGMNEFRMGVISTEENPSSVGELYPIAGPPRGPARSTGQPAMETSYEEPFSFNVYTPVSGGTGADIDLPWTPYGLAVDNNSDCNVTIGLGTKHQGDFIHGLYDLVVNAGTIKQLDWPSPDNLRRRLRYAVAGGASANPGYIRFTIYPYHIGPGGSNAAGPAQQQQAYTAAIAASATVNLTLSPAPSKGFVIANDSATGQAGLAFYFTNLTDSSGNPSYPNPLPASGAGAPYIVQPGKEYAIDIEAVGVKVVNQDAANAGTYRVWITS